LNYFEDQTLYLIAKPFVLGPDFRQEFFVRLASPGSPEGFLHSPVFLN
jgi:hypothetical protein